MGHLTRGWGSQKLSRVPRVRGAPGLSGPLRVAVSEADAWRLLGRVSSPAAAPTATHGLR